MPALPFKLGHYQGRHQGWLGMELAPNSAVKAPELQKKHILVVDDEPLVCEAVTMLLRFDGHVVDTAKDGEEALAIFALSKFDLVITDFFMPRMTGDKLASAIKSRAPKQPIMLLTAYQERFRSSPDSIDIVMGKPPLMESLREAITKLATV